LWELFSSGSESLSRPLRLADLTVPFQIGFDIFEDQSRIFPLFTGSSRTVSMYPTVRVSSEVCNRNATSRAKLRFLFEPRFQRSSTHTTASDLTAQTVYLFAKPSFKVS